MSCEPAAARAFIGKLLQSAAVVSVGGEAGVLWAAASGSARTFQPT